MGWNALGYLQIHTGDAISDKRSEAVHGALFGVGLQYGLVTDGEYD